MLIKMVIPLKVEPFFAIFLNRAGKKSRARSLTKGRSYKMDYVNLKKKKESKRNSLTEGGKKVEKVGVIRTIFSVF